MDQQILLKTIPNDKFAHLTKNEIIDLCIGLQEFNNQLLKKNKELENERLGGEQKSFFLNEQLFNIKNKLFGRSSEKSERKSKNIINKKEPKKRVRLPSDRYKNLDIIEKDVEFDELPACPCCQNQMKNSGLFETCEYLTFIPRKYYVARERRHKYNCSKCYGALVAAPAIPRIIPGGAYSDEMIIDVSMSKFLDLVPIDRYTQTASREGLDNLPANSLINTTHKLADYIEESYRLIKEEVFDSDIIHADETPHRMLEGDKKSNWYLWGFSSKIASYFEVQDTRSGDVASNLLIDSNCLYLMSDVFSGYKKAVRQANEKREEKIIELNCNAHARRKFLESKINFDEATLFIKLYKKIYRLNSIEYEVNLDEFERRKWQNIYMRLMERIATRIKSSFSSKSSMGKAVNYFLNNFEKLVRFTSDPKLPIDNNSQERELRSPVIGRKTWYGTHSKRGGKTTAIMFTIVQSCKLNKINPRKYLTDLVRALHQGLPAYSPYQYRLNLELAKQQNVD